MAKRLNKQLVAGLTIIGMVITTAACIVMVMSLPQRDPGPAAQQAAEFAAKGNYEGAVQWYQKAYQRSRSGGEDTSESSKYLILLGDAYLGQGNAREALLAWGQAILNDPTNEEAQQKIVEFRLELARIHRGSWASVQTATKTLLNINPQNYTGLHSLGLALINQRNIKEENLAEGAEKLRQAFEGDKSNAEFANDLAGHYFQEGQMDKAIEVYDELMAHLSEDPESQADAWRYRGRFYVVKKVREQTELRQKQQGRSMSSELEQLKKQIEVSNTEALRCLNRALELAPKDEENLIALGEYWTFNQSMLMDNQEQEQERQYAQAKAEDYFKQAIQANPEGYEAYLRLSRLHVAFLKQLDEAAQVLNERRKRGIQREGYLGFRNKWFMSTLHDELFSIYMAQAEPKRGATKIEDNQNEGFLDLIKRMEELYQEQSAELGEDNPGVLFMKGRLCWLQRKRPDAIKAFERAEKLLPETAPRLKSYQAQLYLEMGEYGPAQEALGIVLQTYPNNASTWATMAKLQFQLGDLGKSRQAVERALAIQPGHRNAMLTLMRIYERQENWDKVREIQRTLAKQGDMQDKLQRAVINRAQALSSDEPDQALLDEAEKLLREVLQENPLNSPALRQLIMILARDSDRAEELRKLINDHENIVQSKLETERAATQPSEDTQALCETMLTNIERLKVLADLNATKEERFLRLEEIIKRGDDPFVVAMELYQLYSQMKDRADDAYAQLQKAYELRKDKRGVITSLFKMALQRKDWALAEDLVDKAIAMGLDRSGGHFYRGRLLMARTDIEGNFSAAAEHFRAGLLDFPTYSQGHLFLAQALVQMKQYDEAQRSFEESLRMNPRNGAAALGLASLAALRGQEAAKIKWLNLCNELVPNHPWVKAEMQVLEDIRDPAKGIARREEIRRSDPTDGNNLYRLARLYEQEGEYGKAKDVFEECRKIEPNNFRLIDEYVRFLRTKTPPEPELATHTLRELVQQYNDPEQAKQKATAQLLLATHLDELNRLGGDGAPDQKTCDEAYEAAGAVTDSATIAMDVGLYYQADARFDKAESWFRKAVVWAQAAKQSVEEQMAHERLIDAIVQLRDPAREKELVNELDAYQKKYDNAFIRLARAEYHAYTGQLSRALDLIEEYIDLQPDNPLGYLRRGDVNFQRSLWEAALTDYRKAKALNPSGYNYQHRLRLARCLENLGRIELALSELSSILAEDNNNLNALGQIIRLCKKTKRWEVAEKLLLDRLQKQPETHYWPFQLLNLYIDSGDADKAIQYGKEAVEKSQFALGAVAPLLDAYLRFKRYDELMQYVNKTLPLELRQSPSVTLVTATAYAAQGDQLRAMEAYNRIMDMLANQLQPFTNVAMQMIRSLGITEARQLIQTRLANNPDERPSKFVMGFFEKEDGGLDSFVATINGLLETLPANEAQAIEEKLYLMHRLANVYDPAAGQADERKKTYEEILKINPSDAMSLNNLAYLLMEHYNDPQSALPYAQQAVRVMPSEPNVLDTLGWNQTLLGNYDDAISMLRRSIGINDGLPAVHYHAAEVFHQRAEKNVKTRDADLREAKTECRRAHELIMAAGSDPDGLLEKIVALGDKLGLILDKRLPSG